MGILGEFSEAVEMEQVMTSKNLIKLATFALAFLAFLWVIRPDDAIARSSGPPRGTVLIIRHAEKPLSGPALSPEGMARAQAYASYFQHFQIDGQSLDISALVATADSPESQRPRLTLEPLGNAVHIEIQQPFGDSDVKSLAEWLAATGASQVTLVAWHHGKLPKLLKHLGADPNALLPEGIWPDDVYNWVVVLQYDQDGNLISARRVVEQF